MSKSALESIFASYEWQVIKKQLDKEMETLREAMRRIDKKKKRYR